MRESVILPSTASSTMASSIRSTRPLFCESVSRKPRPIDDGDELGRDEEQPRLCHREPQAGDDRRQHGRQLHGREQRRPAQPVGPADLDEVLVDVPQRGGDGRVHGEERADRDERDLRLLADLHPEDEQRDPRQRRHRADRAERRARAARRATRESPTTAPAQQPERRADREAEEHALHRDRDVLAELRRAARGRRRRHDRARRGSWYGGTSPLVVTTCHARGRERDERAADDPDRAAPVQVRRPRRRRAAVGGPDAGGRAAPSSSGRARGAAAVTVDDRTGPGGSEDGHRGSRSARRCGGGGVQRGPAVRPATADGSAGSANVSSSSVSSAASMRSWLATSPDSTKIGPTTSSTSRWASPGTRVDVELRALDDDLLRDDRVDARRPRRGSRTISSGFSCAHARAFS